MSLPPSSVVSRLAVPGLLVLAVVMMVAGMLVGNGQAHGPEAIPRKVAAEVSSGSSQPGANEPKPRGGREELLGRGDVDEADVEDERQEIAEPLRIVIPVIGVDSRIVPVGLEDDGQMEVPESGRNESGWYTEGPKPGAVGPATVVAHVDNSEGADVFYRLSELEVGDEAHVHRADDSTVTFVVEDAERAHKDELPNERIWGWTEEPTLRLITCHGRWDETTGHYEDNYIVYLDHAEG